jgi:hypothetical protein
MRVTNALVRVAAPAAPAVACCAILFAPWATTGTATRSGLAFLRAASAAGLLGTTGAHVFEAFVFALPALAALSCAAAVLRAPIVSAISSGIAGLVIGAFALEMFIVFGAHAAVGPWFGVVGGAGAIAMSARYSTKVWPWRAHVTGEGGTVQNA